MGLQCPRLSLGFSVNLSHNPCKYLQLLSVWSSQCLCTNTYQSWLNIDPTTFDRSISSIQGEFYMKLSRLISLFGGSFLLLGLKSKCLSSRSKVNLLWWKVPVVLNGCEEILLIHQIQKVYHNLFLCWRYFWLWDRHHRGHAWYSSPRVLLRNRCVAFSIFRFFQVCPTLADTSISLILPLLHSPTSALS